MTHSLFQVIVIICVLLIAWWCLQRFSPDPLVTKIGQVIIFLVALFLIITKLLPMVGISFECNPAPVC